MTEIACSELHPFRCDLCPKSYPHRTGLNIHKNIVHHGIRRSCPICGMLSTSKWYIKCHIASVHERFKPFPCSHCDKTYSSQISLKEHVNIFHNDNQQKLKCETCAKYFIRKAHLLKHKRLEHKQEVLLKCRQCPMKFTKKVDKQSHERMHNANIRILKCDVCDEEFVSVVGQARHNKKFHPSDEVQVASCVFCGMVFKNEKLLGLHILRHTEEKLYNCELCKNSFYTDVKRKQHMRTHTKERPYKCDLCEKRFSARSSFKLHISRHLMLKPHECVFCNKTFYLRQKLWNHILREVGEMWYSCDVCKKECSSSSLLREHEMIHRPAKFKCDKYNETFRYRRQMNAHMKKFHFK